MPTGSTIQGFNNLITCPIECDIFAAFSGTFLHKIHVAIKCSIRIACNTFVESNGKRVTILLLYRSHYIFSFLYKAKWPNATLLQSWLSLLNLPAPPSKPASQPSSSSHTFFHQSFEENLKKSLFSK